MVWTALPAFLPVIFLGYTDVFKKSIWIHRHNKHKKVRLFSNPKRSPPSIMQDYPDSHNTKHCRWRIWQFTFLQNHVSAHHLTVLSMGHREDLSDGTEGKGGPIGPGEGGQTRRWWFIGRQAENTKELRTTRLSRWKEGSQERRMERTQYKFTYHTVLIQDNHGENQN